jgi:hypothetical protein
MSADDPKRTLVVSASARCYDNLTVEGDRETAGVHYVAWWCDDRVAARGAGAAASDASDRSSERQIVRRLARSSWPHLDRVLTRQVFSSIEM